MTRRGIIAARRRIDNCKEKNQTEALIRLFHLNKALFHFILIRALPEMSLKDKKMKQVMDIFIKELDLNERLKMLINKKNSKPVKLWFKQMDSFMKDLKNKWPSNQNHLIHSGEAVFLLLHMSDNKLLPGNDGNQ